MSKDNGLEREGEVGLGKEKRRRRRWNHVIEARFMEPNTEIDVEECSLDDLLQ